MKIMVSAGEVSGDLHGSYLVRELKKIDPDIYFFGLGSDRLRAAGVDIRFDVASRGTIGIFEALPHALPIFFVFRRLVDLLKKEKPDFLLLIDSQGINMPLARAAKRLGIKTIYYIPPQEWLWGTPAGLNEVVKIVDLIIAIFEKEFIAYKKAGGNVIYFGHPLLDIVKPSLQRAELRKKFLGTDENNFMISLCPGSRIQEINTLLPILIKSAKIIKKRIPRSTFFIPAASDYIAKIISNRLGSFKNQLVIGQTYDLLFASDLALCASGTVNLEASILGVPNIMIYKLSPLTYFIGKHILKIDKKLPFFSMPNIILNENVIPELVMGKADPSTIANEAISILSSPSRISQIKNSFSRLKYLLGEPNVLPNISKSIFQFFTSSQ